MDPSLVTDKLIELVQSTRGVDIVLTTPKSFPGTAAKFVGRVGSLFPASLVDSSRANEYIHTLAASIPYMGTREGIKSFCDSADRIVPAKADWVFKEGVTIVDFFIVSIGLSALLFKNPPYSHSRLMKYLEFLRKDRLFSDAIGQQQAQELSGKKFIERGTGGRYRIEFVLNSPHLIGSVITVKGWARTARVQGGGTFAFIELNDGSCMRSLQIVVDKDIPNFSDIKGTGISVACKGLLIESPGSNQPVEMQVKDPAEHSFEVIGDCDQKNYPLAKKQHSLEFLRSIGHLRSRTNTIGAVARVRNALAFATHRFFNERGFLYIHTPIITASDCEGAGELFEVSSKLSDEQIEKRRKQGKSTEFFGRPAFLTCSGQLAVENYCIGLSDVYTFGPTFRAEQSHTSRHLAEFWMIEPEMAFAGLEDNMECAESYLKFCIQSVFDNNLEDLLFFEQRFEPGLIQRLQEVLEKPFARLTYTEAVEILHKSGMNFEEGMPQWGDDLKAEHERYVCEQVIKGPVIVYNYPKVLKAFYMLVNDDDLTVQAMDILVPQIGEVVGGSVREHRIDKLDGMIKYKQLNEADYWWYRDLRKYGSVPHAGFGLGFERLIMMVTGVENIRDVIPYPRWEGHAEF